MVAHRTDEGQADWAYDPAEDAWSELPPDPSGCGEGREGVWGGDRLVVFARPCPTPPERGIEPGLYYRVATLDLGTGTWRSLPDTGVAGWGSWSVHGDKLVSLAVGAYDRVDNGLARPHELGGVLDLDAGTWTPISRPGPEVIAAPSAGFHGTAGSWVVTGRRMYDPDTGQWQVIPPPPTGTSDDAAAVWTGTEILVWGGVTGDGGLVGTGAAFSPPEP